ncbi:MAG TPA: hypothetical protein PK156_38410 [Polyangium sp.]|nr:hypothetical protein [Polyangium sp.]
MLVPRMFFAAACVTLLAGTSKQTWASSFEVQGIGPEGIAAVNARSAGAEDGSAAFYNPGGLAFGQTATLVIAPTLSLTTLQAQDKPLPFADPFGLTLTASVALPLEGPLAKRIRIGFSGYFLPTTALRLLARSPEQPLYPYYDNRTQRLTAVPAIGIRLADWLGVGIGANILAGVRGPAKLEQGATGAPEPRIDIAASTVVSTIAGIRFDPSRRVHLALVFRQAFGIPLDIETTANVGGIPLATNLKAPQAMFDPRTFVLASRLQFGPVNVEGDVAYAQWSTWGGPYLSVQSTLPGVNLVSRSPSGLFRDTMSFRLGSNYSRRLSAKTNLVLRAGLAFEPTILTGQRQGRTNLVDGDKFTIGLGASVVLQNLIGKALRLGIGGNSQFLSPFQQDKLACSALPCPESTVVGLDANNPSSNITNPGYPSLRAGGAFITLSSSAGVDF